MRSARGWTVLEQVQGLEGEALREAIDRACGDDASLHVQVVGLLGRRAHPSIDLRVEPVPAPAPCSEQAPARAPSVPGFTLLQRLGEGAAGVVYEAEQHQPRRSVALKVFVGRRTQADQRQRIAHEAEVLARLQHPSIAQVHAVHDGHDTPGAPPWIAMELVRGVPIDAWCHEQRLTLDQRVQLLATVAEAVAHAHASGVVHRDLKPSNVLVTALGVPKVVDFGLAKTLGEAPAAGTLHTREGDLVGTIAYMAAEQAQGQTSLVDTRTDVHALGVLAYEVLAGRLPRDPRGKSLPDWARELSRPAPSLREALPAAPLDLALVVGKALQGERERRYPTAQAFADDLRRYLTSQPVTARAPTRGYLLCAFARRHRPLVAASLAGVLALATGLVVSIQATLASTAERLRADQEAHEARRESYRARTSVASEALAAGNAFAARAALDAAPAGFRGWEWRYLDAQVERAARVVPYAVRLERWRSVAHDGSRIAGGLSGGRAVVLDARTGRILRRLGAGAPIERGALLADGTRIVLARAGGLLEVVDVESGAATPLNGAHDPGGAGARRSECDVLCVSPVDGRVCESRRDAVPRLRIVDVDSGVSTFHEAPDAWAYLGLSFSADASALGATSADGKVLRWDLRAGGPARVVGLHSGVAHGLAFLPDGRHMVSCGVDRHLLRLGIQDGSSETLALHQQLVTAVAVSPDGRRVASWSGERVLRIFDAADGRILAAWQALGAGEHASVRFSADGREVEVDDDQARRVWFVTPDTHLDVLKGHRSLGEGNPLPYVYDVAFSPDGRRVATAGWDGTVRIFSVLTGSPLAVLVAPGPVQALAWSRDGARIAATGRPHHVTLFDATTGRELARAEDGHTWMVGGVTFSADGRHLLTTSADDGPVVRDARTLRRERPLGARRWIWSSASGPAGAVVGYGDGTWEWRPGGFEGPPTALPAHRAALVGVAVSPDGSLVAGASEDGSASLVETACARRRALIRSHVGRVYAVAFSPDGARLATGGDDGTVRLHDTASGAEVLVLRGHTSYVHGLAFAPDGVTLASASGDNTARLWSTQPLAARVRARDRELEREAALAARVEALLAAGGAPDRAARVLGQAPDLDAAGRSAALDVLLRSVSLGPSAPGAVPSAAR